MLIGGLSVEDARNRATSMLKSVGLRAREEHKPGELSGGERQRVAIARALVTAPQCVLLDEPTGNLDRQTAEEIQSLMMDLNQALTISFIVVTHDERLAKSMDRKLILKDGRLHE